MTHASAERAGRSILTNIGRHCGAPVGQPSCRRRSGGQVVSVWSREDGRKWRALDGADRRLLIEAGLWLIVADATLKLLPFRHTAVLFGLRLNRPRSTELSASPGKPAPVAAARSAWAVAVAAGRTPLPARC